MKKILSLLSVMTISATAIPKTIAASSYQKQENKLENLNRAKRQENIFSKSYENWSEIEFSKIKNLENNLKKIILGQDYVISKVKTAVNKTYFNFNKNDKPVAQLFFAGPTGVGKTFFVENLVKNIFDENYKNNKQFINFDMSDYNTIESEKNLITKLSSFNCDNINILLFDEIEKANPVILDKFLQILDKAKLNTDDKIRGNKLFGWWYLISINIYLLKQNP